MSHRYGISLTTTPTIDGWIVEEVLGPVIGHAVRGSNFISDWFATWSDVFGGRSGAYQNQLALLREDAVRELLREAADRRANWVVALTIDFDEIGGQGKQMFMATVMGTAVRARRASSERTGGAGTGDPVRHEDVAIARRRSAALAELASGHVRFTETLWHTVTESRLVGAIPFIISLQMTSSVPEPPLTAYFAALEPSDAVEAIYRELARVTDDGRASVILALIKRYSLADYAQARHILESRTAAPVAKRAALQTVSIAQRIYQPEVVAHLDGILACLTPAVFPEVTQPAPAKVSLFGGSTPAVTCECGTTRKADVLICPSCSRDRHGFRADAELNLRTAPAAVREFRALLAQLFDERGLLRASEPPEGTVPSDLPAEAEVTP